MGITVSNDPQTRRSAREFVSLCLARNTKDRASEDQPETLKQLLVRKDETRLKRSGKESIANSREFNSDSIDETEWINHDDDLAAALLTLQSLQVQLSHSQVKRRQNRAL